jgi:hypothetical protein
LLAGASQLSALPKEQGSPTDLGDALVRACLDNDGDPVEGEAVANGVNPTTKRGADLQPDGRPFGIPDHESFGIADPASAFFPRSSPDRGCHGDTHCRPSDGDNRRHARTDRVPARADAAPDGHPA